MTIASYFLFLPQAASNLISNTLRDGEQLGLVTFSNAGRIAARLTVVNEANRQYLLSKVPDFANGATSIGAGKTFMSILQIKQ